MRIEPFIGEANIERLLTVLRGEIPDRVPNFEILSDVQRPAIEITLFSQRDPGNVRVGSAPMHSVPTDGKSNIERLGLSLKSCFREPTSIGSPAAKGAKLVKNETNTNAKPVGVVLIRFSPWSGRKCSATANLIIQIGSLLSRCIRWRSPFGIDDAPSSYVET